MDKISVMVAVNTENWENLRGSFLFYVLPRQDDLIELTRVCGYGGLRVKVTHIIHNLCYDRLELIVAPFGMQPKHVQDALDGTDPNAARVFEKLGFTMGERIL